MNGIETKRTYINERMFDMLDQNKSNKKNHPYAFYLGKKEYRELEIIFLNRYGLDIIEHKGNLMFRGVIVYEVYAEEHLALAYKDNRKT